MGTKNVKGGIRQFWTAPVESSKSYFAGPGLKTAERNLVLFTVGVLSVCVIAVGVELPLYMLTTSRYECQPTIFDGSAAYEHFTDDGVIAGMAAGSTMSYITEAYFHRLYGRRSDHNVGHHRRAELGFCVR